MIKFFHSILSVVDLKIYQFKTPFSHLMNLNQKYVILRCGEIYILKTPDVYLHSGTASKRSDTCIDGYQCCPLAHS